MVKTLESRRTPLNGGAFLGRLGLLYSESYGQGWGGSVSWLWSDRAGTMTGSSHPETRLWIMFHHRRTIGGGLFRYWEPGAGIQVNSSADEWQFTSTPLIVEVNVGLGGVLKLGVVSEFYSYEYEDRASYISNGVETVEVIPREGSSWRISMTARFAFGAGQKRAK
ncbi:MAG: hypothetical protein ABIK96_12555 [bacterium]